MAYSKNSLRILGFALGTGLIVTGLTAIAVGSFAVFGGCFGAGALVLLGLGVWELRQR